MTDLKYLDPQELLDGGYLQEVNRLFFHPMGLALAVDPDPTKLDRDTREPGQFVVQVWDCRDDPEGIRFGPPLPDPIKAAAIAAHHAQRRPLREAELGYWIQPVDPT